MNFLQILISSVLLLILYGLIRSLTKSFREKKELEKLFRD